MDFPLYFQKVMLLWQGSIVGFSEFLVHMNENNLSSCTKYSLTHSFKLHLRANFQSTLGGSSRVYIQSKLFMAAQMSVLGLILSFYPYLRSAMVRFPLSELAFSSTSSQHHKSQTIRASKLKFERTFSPHFFFTMWWCFSVKGLLSMGPTQSRLFFMNSLSSDPDARSNISSESSQDQIDTMNFVNRVFPQRCTHQLYIYISNMHRICNSLKYIAFLMATLTYKPFAKNGSFAQQ